jgi:hypothetical protein
MLRHKNYNLSANEDFVIFLTPKLITHFTDSFTSKNEISINCLLTEWK